MQERTGGRDRLEEAAGQYWKYQGRRTRWTRALEEVDDESVDGGGTVASSTTPATHDAQPSDADVIAPLTRTPVEFGLQKRQLQPRGELDHHHWQSCSVPGGAGALARVLTVPGAAPRTRRLWPPGVGLRAWRMQYALRPDGPGRTLSARCGRTTASAVAPERRFCELVWLVARLPRGVVQLLRGVEAPMGVWAAEGNTLRNNPSGRSLERTMREIAHWQGAVKFRVGPRNMGRRRRSFAQKRSKLARGRPNLTQGGANLNRCWSKFADVCPI